MIYLSFWGEGIFILYGVLKIDRFSLKGGLNLNHKVPCDSKYNIIYLELMPQRFFSYMWKCNVTINSHLSQVICFKSDGGNSLKQRLPTFFL